jgi:hypothetical protein
MRDYLITNKHLEHSKYDHIFNFEKWIIYYNDNLDFELSQSNDLLLIIDGLINYKGERVNKNELIKDIMNTGYLDVDYDGQFTIYLISKQFFWVITDFINFNKSYYYIELRDLFISNNLFELVKLKKEIYSYSYEEAINYNGLLQLLSPPLYSNIFNITIINGIFSFLNATKFKLNFEFEFEIVHHDNLFNREKHLDVNKLDEILINNVNIYKSYFNKVLLPISGGVDSRVTLYSVLNCFEKNNIETITHGESNDIEVKIVKKIVYKLGLWHQILSIKNLYLQRDVLFGFLESGLNLLIAKWLPIKYFIQNRNNKDTLILLGDILDLLRAKNIKSIRSRKDRILIQLGLFNFENSKYTVELSIVNIKKRHFSIISKTFYNYIKLFEAIELNLLLEKEDAIFSSLVDHILQVYKPTDGFEFEEYYYINTWGKNSMGSQSRLLNQLVPTYVISGNRHYVKFLLSIPFNLRFEDKLVHDILKETEFSDFPTTQVPFVNFSRPLFLKYFLWAFRSTLDQILMKFARKIKSKKNRLFSIENWQQIYLDNNNMTNFHSYFKYSSEEFSYIIQYYNNRASGKSRSLNDIDLSAAIIPAFIIDYWKLNEVEKIK